MKTKQLSLFALVLFMLTSSIGVALQSAQLELSNDLQNSQQNIYKRIRINTPSESSIQQLDVLGIDLTCGVILKDNQITLELFDYELDILTQEGIPYTVLIDNMQKFYSDRAVEDLPKARMEIEQLKALSSQKSYSVNEILNNVGQYDGCSEIDWAVPVNWNLNPTASPNSFGGCLTYTQVLQELDDMRTLYPNLISVKTDASPTNQTTIEGRTVYYVRISDNPDIDEAGEPETLYQSLIHSREAATVMNQLYFMWYLLENYATDDSIKNLVNNQALYFIPVYNPDGFVHNQTVAPDGGGGQRKNRNVSAGSCGTYTYGIDLNRNSQYYWNNGGSSSDPCNQTYRGTTYFSEPETQIMRDFFLLHDFELALNHHSYKNAMLHAYAGTTITNPRPDEYSKYNHDMTYYNRYAHGPSTSISALNSGNMNDWMLGGPSGPGSNGTGSGKQTMAWTPENGLSSEGTGGSYGGFWPQPSNYLPIAKRAMRMNFMAAYFSGKYAKLHDLNQSDITTLSGNFNFAIENLGQTASDFTLTVTAVSTNILTVGSPSTQTGMTVLQQNNVAITYTLDPSIQADDELEFKVVLTNDYAADNVLYEANIVKRYNPTVIFSDNPDTDNLTNWTQTGTWFTTSDAYSGTTAITSTNTAPYANSDSKQLQMNGTIDLTGLSTVLIQYYGKWDLERSFDYAQLEGSTNGSTWTPLCGRLTKPGAPDANNTYSGKSSTNNNFQPDGEDLYDGDTQDKWSMEEVVIDATTNAFLYNQSTVFLRFDFRTDGTNREDSYYNADFEGFSFDDFKVISVSLPDSEAPTAPANLAASNTTDTSTDLSWDASTDNVGVTGYDVYQDTVMITNVTGTTYQVIGLTENTSYDFYVIARDAAANSSAASNTVNVTTLVGPSCTDGIQNGDETGIDCGGTICPPCLTVTLNEGYFETGFDGWTDGGNDCARVLTSNSFEGSYSIRLRDNSGTSSSMTSPGFDLTTYESVEVSFYYYPNSMENGEDFWLQYNDGGGWVTLTTYASGTDFQNGGFYSDTVTITSSQYNFNSNSQFRFRCDASANNDQVYIDQVITIGTLSGPPDSEPPTAPGNLTASNTTEFTTDLSWDASTDNVGVSGYDVYQNGGLITTATGTTHQVTGLSPSTMYSFYIIARDAAGNSSPQSNTVNVTTLDDTSPPTAPGNLTASNTTESTTDLNWNASSDNVGVTGYDVYQDTVFIINVPGTSYQVTGLTENTSYNFYVIARDAAGNSSLQSNTVNVTTLAAPTCTDGIQNGDETGVDCGGSVCPPCSSQDVIINQGFFETGFDGWTDGGNDCARVLTSFSWEGSYSIRLRDNSGTNAAMTLSNIDMTPYEQVEVDFYFYVNSMENGEDFWLRFNDGVTWITVATWTSGIEINNSTFYNATITFTPAEYAFAVNSGFRFQCDASGNNDQIYIDEVTITGTTIATKMTNNLVMLSTLEPENAGKESIRVYPNPVKSNVLYVDVPGVEEWSYTIKNIQGKKVMTGSSTKAINVRALKSGMYFINVNDGDEIITKRFIKD